MKASEQKNTNKAPTYAPRQRLWMQIREHAANFTLVEVAHNAEMKEGSARSYVRGLELAGFIEKSYEETIPNKRVKRVHYKLIKDIGFWGPSVDKQGNIVDPARINNAMWNTLRIHQSAFNAEQLAALSSTGDEQISVNTANEYLRALYAAGYLALVEMAQNVAGKKAKYRLFAHMNTGPLSPQIQRCKQVFDANTGEVVFREQPELEEELKHGTTLESAS